VRTEHTCQPRTRLAFRDHTSIVDSNSSSINSSVAHDVCFVDFFPDELTQVFKAACVRCQEASRPSQRRQSQGAAAQQLQPPQDWLLYEGFVVAIVDVATQRADAVTGGGADAGAGALAGADGVEWNVSRRSAQSAGQPATAAFEQALRELLTFDLGIGD
jgi:hypothetical protein